MNKGDVSLVISVVSLLLSFTSFFWTNIRVVHDLSLSASYASDRFGPGGPINDSSTALTLQTIVMAKGTRAEAVTRLALAYKVRFGMIGSPGPAPFILKPGELRTDTLQEDMKNLLANLAQQNGDWAELGILTCVLLPNGKLKEQFHHLGKVRVGKEVGGSPYAEVMLDDVRQPFTLVNEQEMQF